MLMKHLVFFLLSIICLEARAYVLKDSVVFTIDKEIPSYIDFFLNDNDGKQIKIKSKEVKENIDLRNILNLKDETSALLIDSIKDTGNMVHYFYEELYKGIKVEGTRYTLHYKDNILISMNGNFRTISNLNTDATITKNEAIRIAYDHENLLQYIENSDSDVIDNINHNIVIYIKEKPLLVYKIFVYATSPFISKYVYVDAHNGNVVGSFNTIRHDVAIGKAETLYARTREINTSLTPQGFTLNDTNRNVLTRNKNGYNYFDDDNYWSKSEWNNSSMDIAALDVHWGVEKTYDYYLKKFNRNSYDNKGGIINCFVNIDEENAAWVVETQSLYFGRTTNTSNVILPLTSLDVVSHEFTHGVTQYTSDLDYQGESGALNEGFSDIFAVCVENWAMPEKRSKCFVIGDDFIDTKFIRSISNPSCKYYKGEGWIDTNNVAFDYGGVHTNSGVLSYWFYLLVHGGDGLNGGRYYSVQPISFQKAEQLCYTLLTSYLTSNSNYSDAVLCSVRASIALFGDNSFEHRQVLNAWYAVGLTSVSQFDLQGPTYVCDNAQATYILKTDSEFSVETSSNIKLISKVANEIVIEGNSYSSPGYIKIIRNGNVVNTKEIWVGSPAVSNITYSNGYFFAHFLCDVSAVTSISWIMNGIYRTTSDTFVYFDGQPNNGSVNVSITAYNSCGQSREFSTIIEVPDEKLFHVIKAEDTNDIFVTRTGEVETLHPSIAFKYIKYYVANANTGHIYSKGEIPDTGGVIKLNCIPKGVYLLKLIVNSGKIETTKILFK